MYKLKRTIALSVHKQILFNADKVYNQKNSVSTNTPSFVGRTLFLFPFISCLHPFPFPRFCSPLQSESGIKASFIPRYFFRYDIKASLQCTLQTETNTT